MILISFTLLLALVSLVSGEECKIKNSCECVYSDGSGYSLKNLLKPPNLRINGYAEDNKQIFFSPCVDTTDLPSLQNVTKNDCSNGYTLCLYDPAANQTFVLGTAKDTTIKADGDQIYMNFGPDAGNISTIQLQCTVNAKTSTLYAPIGTKVGNVNLILYSNDACVTVIEKKESPGFFSTFFLIAFIILFVYLAGGIVYNYLCVGARGFELIPNYDFWCKVWTSLKLGFYYVKNGCRIVPTDDSYDAI